LRRNHFSEDELSFVAPFTHLKIVDFGGNRLKEIPEILLKYTSLRSLGLSYNMIELLPKEIGRILFSVYQDK